MAVAEEIHIKPLHLATLMLALFGGNLALTTQWTKPEAVRPDPYTGSMARLDQDRIRQDIDDHVLALQKQIDSNSRRIDALRDNLNLCMAKMHAHGSSQ